MEAVENTLPAGGVAPAEATTKKGSRARKVFPALVFIAASGALIVWAHGRGRESTDDAQVDGHIVSVSPRVSGQVTRVEVRDNQVVHAGDVLVVLDTADLQARLATARADLASAHAGLTAARAQLALTERTIEAYVLQARGGVRQAVAGISASQAGINEAQAALQAAESRRSLARIELQRVRALRAEGAISQAELDARQSSYDQTEALVTQSMAALVSARTGVTSSSALVESAHGRMLQAETGPQQVDVARAAVDLADARVLQADAAVHIAELNLSYATVYAPVDGVVSRRTVEPGQQVGPERPLLALVPTNDIWVVANFKEDQMEEMRPGQPVTVRIDTYGGRRFNGHVDSIAAASGARFALLPPDNASGNFTKVVQRIPVLIRFDGSVGVRLVSGMSADVTVRTDR